MSDQQSDNEDPTQFPETSAHRGPTILVLGIVGTLMFALGVIAGAGFVLIGCVNHKYVLEDARDDVARTQTYSLTQAAQLHRLSSGEFPASLQELTQPLNGHAPILDSNALKDPWGRPYKYDKLGPRNGGKVPDIWSEGSKEDGTTHIGNWMSAK
jgi:Type II secretion system (T2SS), protein G